MKTRTIIHLDLDAFFCSVEEQHNPNLQGKAFAVGGRPEERGVVASCSYPARAFGVRSAMPMGKAIRLCPGLAILPARHRLYSEISSQIMEILRKFTPDIEQVSIDEAYLEVDVTVESGPDIAIRLQQLIFDDFKLPCSLGVASNKLVAKIANDFGKSTCEPGRPPYALTVVQPGQEEQFLAPLPVIALLGVGPKTAERLETIGIRLIGDLANRTPEELRRLFGKIGLDLWLHARGIDESPLTTSHEIKSISQEITFTRDIGEERVLRQTIVELAEQVGKRLRETRYSATTVKIKIRWPDFITLTRQASFNHPIQEDNQIIEAGIFLFEKVWQAGKHVRLIGIGVSNLHGPTSQLSLFQPGDPEDSPLARTINPQLQATLDLLRERYGEQAILPASKLVKQKEK